MKRVASLDFLRGLAAFSVAIPHYLTLNGSERPLVDAIAVTGVEAFFVLSGFVLAPQILTIIIGGPVRSLRIFIIRRWMRTIPPYLIALIFIAIVTGELLTPDFARYVFYIQNLFSQANLNDFFPIAWSLSVEEWFYITFAPLLFVLATVFDRKDGAFAAAFGICFILLILVARHFGDYGNWDAAVRRVTIFRIDSIAWGFLLFIATKRVAPFEIGTSMGRTLLGASLGLFLACGFVAVATAYHTSGSVLSRQAFPFVAAAFGISAVFLFRQAEFLFVGNAARKIGIFLGHISYSVYLFHLLVAMTIKPALTGLDITLQIAIFVVLLVCLTSVIWLYIEKPILAARPKYDVGEISFYQTVDNTPRAAPKSVVAAATPAIFAFAFSFYCLVAYQGNHQKTFYLTFIAASAFALVAASRIRISSITATFLTLFFFSILLPPVEYIFRKSNTAVFASTSAVASLPLSPPKKPAYAFKSGNADPEAFHVWWAQFVDEWTKLGGAKGATEKPDPKGLLPFVLNPNSTGRFFESVIRINNLGFRGIDVERDKHDRFRIFALGESPTWGPTLHAGDRTWPEYLQGFIDTGLTCDRPIEVINAGTEAYTLAYNIERLERDIVPLEPDLVISYHGYNGLGVLFGNAPFSNTVQEPQRIENRPSALFKEISYRARLMIFRFLSEKQAFPIYTEDQIMKSEYANNYRKLLRIARDNGFRAILASSSMAVGRSSPPEVKKFYGVVFGGIGETIIRNAAHNEMVRKIAEAENVPFIDTVPWQDGFWDDDLYLDLVHFTQAGNKRMAKIVFDGLSDTLRKDPQLKCYDRK
jgi:peptidoglycan/LPS O-acetylase OafA/YrhL/lysophospholipase L1-like esterase